MRARSGRLILGVAVVCALLAGCARKSLTGSSDTLRIAIQQDARTLNPILASNTVDGFVQRFMFEPLISADAQGNAVPILVTEVPSLGNGGISRDGLSITYHLRGDARWTDGVPVTARDVRFSWQSIVSGDNNAVSHHGYDDVSRIDVPNDRTLIVHLKKPFAPFVSTFFTESDQPYTVVPEHVLGKYRSLNEIPFNSEPTVTDGPFRFERWMHGERIVLTANDAFFLGKPKLRRIVIFVVADENTSVNLLRTREIDYMFQASILTNPVLRTTPGVHLVWVNMNGYEGLGINLRHKPLDDVRVRNAIAYAIDKSEIMRTLTYGNERMATADLPDWMWAANRSLVSDPRDVEKARELMRSARVVTPLHLVLVTESADVTHKRAAVLVQSMLKDIGIDVEVKTYPGDLLYAPAGAGGIINRGNFDLSIWPWYGGVDPDNSAQFSCESIPPNGWNESRYCTPEMDALQRDAVTRVDRSSRATAYHRIEELVFKDKPVIPFWWQRQQEAFSVDLRGFSPNPAVESWNAWQWTIAR